MKQKNFTKEKKERIKANTNNNFHDKKLGIKVYFLRHIVYAK
jgi:hypothetical protein